MNPTFSAREHRGAVLGAAAVLPLLVSAVFAALGHGVTSTTAVLVLVLVVVAAAATGDRIAGIVAALSGGLWYDFFLTQPYRRFTITDPDDITVTVLLVVIGIAVTEVALWGHRQQAGASRRAGYLDGALRTAEIVAARDGSSAALADVVAGQIAEVLGVDACRFVPGPLRDQRLAVLAHDGSVTRNGRPVKVERDGLPSDEETALLVTRADETLGYFVLTAAGDLAYPSLEQRRVAVLLADQVGAALDERTD